MQEPHLGEAHAGPSSLRDYQQQDHDQVDYQPGDSEMEEHPAAADGDLDAEGEGEADGDGDVLYYVDADGNRIDPSDMAEYALQQEEAEAEQRQHQEEEDGDDQHGNEDVSMKMDGDQQVREHQYDTSIRIEQHYESPTAEQTRQVKDEDEEEEEQVTTEDMARYERPFQPLSRTLNSNGMDGQDSHNEAKTPDYALRYTITGHRKNVSCVRFSPSGEWLITAAGDGRVLLYSLSTQQQTQSSTSSTSSTIPSPTFIRSYSIPTPAPVKIRSNQLPTSVPPVGSQGINDVCFSPDSRYFATASDDKIVRIWKIDPFPKERDVLDESVTRAAHPNNRHDRNGTTVNGTNGSTTTMTNGTDGQQQQQHYERNEESTSTTTTTAVLPSSALNKATEEAIELKGHTSFVFCVAFTPQGNLLASGSYDETVRIWDLKRGKCLRVLPAHADPVAAVGFSGDGSVLCSAGHDGLLRLWDTATGQCLKSLVDESNPPASHAVFTPNSRYILVSSLDSTIRLWDYHAAVCIKTYTGHKNVKYHIPAMFAQPPKGKHGATHIITGSEDGKIIFYDLQSRNIAFTLPGHKEAPILCLAHDPHSGMLATCALERGVKEHTVKLWIDRNRIPRSTKGLNGRSNGH